MSGLLNTLNTAKTGMNVSQVAIQTTSHNISNINTPGYSRQKVQQSANIPYSNPAFNSSFGPGQIGTGAQVTDVTRIRNSFYDYQFRSESHEYGSTSVKYDYYKNIESIFNEPSNTAISSSLNNFFNSWNELSKDPQSIGVKNVVIENANNLAANINNVYGKLESLESNLKAQKEVIVGEINEKIQSIMELNKTIATIQGSGKSPNDLLDERDKLLDDLSFKIDVNSDVVQNVLNNLGKSEEEQAENIELLNKAIEDNELSGELSGVISMEENISSYKEKLKILAKTITYTINETYKSGDDTKKDFFISELEDGKLISVNSEIDEDVDNFNISAEISLKIYNMKNEKVNINGKDLTINNFYNNMIQEIGQASAKVIRDESNQGKLLSNIDSSRNSVSGVSLDEEMINLVQFQHAYNASAKVLSTINSLLDVVVNGLVR